METSNHQQDSTLNHPQEPEVFVIGRGFTLDGVVRGRGLCIVEGFVDGSIESTDIKINESGSVKGGLICSRLDVNGKIAGRVDADQLVMRAKALIEGGVTYKTISMEAGSIIDGEMKCNILHKSSTTETNDMALLPFSPEVNELIKHADSVSLYSADGTPHPPWVALHENGILILRTKYSELQSEKEKLSFILSLDGSSVFVKFD